MAMHGTSGMHCPMPPSSVSGTPVSLEDRDTRAVFGDYVSIYDIQDAVDDGATVPIYYESRLAKLDVNHDQIEELSDRVEEVIEEYEDENTREKTKSEWSTLAKLVGAEPRIKQVALHQPVSLMWTIRSSFSHGYFHLHTLQSPPPPGHSAPQSDRDSHPVWPICFHNRWEPLLHRPRHPGCHIC